MARINKTVHVTVKLDPYGQAYLDAMRLLGEAIEDYPWNDDIKEAVELLRMVAEFDRVDACSS